MKRKFCPQSGLKVAFWQQMTVYVMATYGKVLTQFPESRHHVNKSHNALAERLWQVVSEVVAQGEQVMGQVHAVVVLDGS